MPTIIGFVPKDNDFPVLPVGWKEDGNQIDTKYPDWPSECQLILLDDDDYANSIIQGNKKSALLIQHLSKNEVHKKAQQEMLTSWNWLPAKIEEFHRIEESYVFWQDIKELLKSKDDKANRKQIVYEMTNRYGIAHALQKLDTLAAWFILFSSTTVGAGKYNEFYRAFHKNFDLLPDDKKQLLGPLIKIPAHFLKELNSIASAHITL